MTKCFICKKKVSKLFLDLYTCKCEKVVCRKHKLDHNCEYNYKDNNSKKLNQKLVKINNKTIFEI